MEETPTEAKAVKETPPESPSPEPAGLVPDEAPQTPTAVETYNKNVAAKIMQEDKDVIVVDLPKQGLRLWLTKPPPQEAATPAP